MSSAASLANLGNRRYPGGRICPEGPVSGDGRSRSTSREDALSHDPYPIQHSNRAGEPGSGVPMGAALEPLLARFADLLADALAPRLADALAERSSRPATAEEPLRRLVTLDQLVALLPPGKKPHSWKRWLYEHTRHQQVPGAQKIGGRWFFDTERTIPWLLGTDLDVVAEESLDRQPMEPDPKPAHRRRGGS